MRILGKHRVRASFYHISALLFLGFTAMQVTGILEDRTAFYLTAVLFVVDYIAEMFDPHPDNMGPWYKKYFHRAFDNEEE